MILNMTIGGRKINMWIIGTIMMFVAVFGGAYVAEQLGEACQTVQESDELYPACDWFFNISAGR